MISKKKKDRLEMSFTQSIQLILPYCRSKISEQVRSVAPIIVYLVLFQILILRLPLKDSAVITGGIVLVVMGLALFIEGLMLGLMPLGETIGSKLPSRSKTSLIIAFSFILGLGATLAEPSIGILKAAGSFIEPWDAPLLYLLLNRYPEMLVMSVGIGVGLSVVAGMLRFIYGLSLKPFIYGIFSLLLVFSVWGMFDPNMLHLTGLAWDCGAVTTGPVTVPLVIALGIGICRSLGAEDNGAMGFGVVTLASAFPVLAVMILGLFFSGNVPDPMTREQFYNSLSPDMLMYLTGSKDGIADSLNAAAAASSFTLALKGITNAVIAILPLTLFILIVFIFILREKLARKDEIFFGIAISVIGMALFNLGIEFGLAKIGAQVGSKLPASFKPVELVEEQVVIENFDPAIVHTSISKNGVKENFFYVKYDSAYKEIPFDEKNYNPLLKNYTYTPVKGPIFGGRNSLAGLIAVILFAFIMGYGATLAEPALNALGRKVEELTVGTFKRSVLMQAVALGVGTGVAAGTAKIVFDIPLVWLLVPPYIVTLVLTKYSSEEFVNIGWDSAGVTTGPVTVPLVIALGLGIGTQVGVVEGFGILAMASVYPIMAVLVLGIYLERKAKALLSSAGDNEQ